MLVGLGEDVVALKFLASYNTGTRANTARGDGVPGVTNETNSHEAKHKYTKNPLNSGELVNARRFLKNVQKFMPSVIELEPKFALEPFVDYETWRKAQVLIRDGVLKRLFKAGEGSYVFISKTRWENSSSNTQLCQVIVLLSARYFCPR